jgi:sulfide dehydrogenase cytochrome subunit
MNRVAICLLVMALTFPLSAVSADFEALTKKCDSCHGLQGASTDSDVPIIGGQSSRYIADSLAMYRDWGRPCIKSAYRHGDTSRPVTTMCKISADIEFDEMEALGNYYAGQEFVAAKQDFDQAKASTGAVLHEKHCFSCHPESGNVGGRGPILAGQWASYLKTAIDQALSGEHLVPPLMERQFDDFSDEEIVALVNFYASQQ